MSDQQPDTKEGNYYVSVIDTGRYVLALGPFINNHQGALDRVDEVREYVKAHDPHGFWYCYGTSIAGTNRPGKLNAELGI